MGNEFGERIKRAAKDAQHQTASFGVPLNYSRAGEYVKVDKEVGAASKQASSAPQWNRYPRHAEEVYRAGLERDKRTQDEAPPWATNGIRQTGVSVAHCEYSAKANEEFTGLLKQQYRKMKIKSELDAADLARPPSPPATPEFYSRKALTLRSLLLKHRAQSAGPKGPSAAVAAKARCKTPPLPVPPERSDTFDRIFHSHAAEEPRNVRTRVHYGKAAATAPSKQAKMQSFPEPVHDHSMNSYWPVKRQDFRRRKKKHLPATSLHSVWSEEHNPQKLKQEGKRLTQRGPVDIEAIDGFDVHPKKTAKKAWSRRAILEVKDAYKRQLCKSRAADAESAVIREKTQRHIEADR